MEIFNKYGSSTIIVTVAGLFTTRPDHNIAAQVWKQGKEVLDVVMTPDGKQFVQGYVAHPTGQHQTLRGAVSPQLNIGCWWNEMNSLSRQSRNSRLGGCACISGLWSRLRCYPRSRMYSLFRWYLFHFWHSHRILHRIFSGPLLIAPIGSIAYQ